MSFADFRGTQILGQLEFAVKDFHFAAATLASKKKKPAPATGIAATGLIILDRTDDLSDGVAAMRQLGGSEPV
jgi:hypothetical protein